MNASRPLSAALDGTRGSALDLPVAALAGLSIAFAAFAIPVDLLDTLTASSRLGPLFAAVGVDARIGLGAIGALAVSGLVFLLLRWLDRLGAPASGANEPKALRVRRRDAHPDAPPPSPLFAARELAEPDFTAAAARRAGLSETAPSRRSELLLPAEPSRPASLDELVARLEQRLGVGREALDASAAMAVPRERPQPAGDRLQSAIDSLQRLAAGRG